MKTLIFIQGIYLIEYIEIFFFVYIKSDKKVHEHILKTNVDSWLFLNYKCNHHSFYKRGNWTINQTF